MNTRWPARILFVVAIGLSQTTWAQDGANKITVTISAIKESDWQREAGTTTSQTGLLMRLQARTLVKLSGELKHDEETVLRSGEEHSIVTNWDFADDHNDLVAKKTIQELIGTEVRVEPTSTEDARRRLTLTHDLLPSPARGTARWGSLHRGLISCSMDASISLRLPKTRLPVASLIRSPTRPPG